MPVRPAEPVAEQATQPIEVLIKEARRRQRRRQLAMTGAVLTVALVGLVVYRTTSTVGSPSPHPSVKRPGRPLPLIAAGAFTGTWRVHTTTLTIQANGQGSASWPGPIKSGESEATAASGHADLRVKSVSGTRALALVSGSTQRSTLPDGPVRLRVTSQDLLLVVPTTSTTQHPFGGSGLCGPRALALTLTQQVAAGINCGA